MGNQKNSTSAANINQSIVGIQQKQQNCVLTSRKGLLYLPPCESILFTQLQSNVISHISHFSHYRVHCGLPFAFHMGSTSASARQPNLQCSLRLSVYTSPILENFCFILPVCACSSVQLMVSQRSRYTVPLVDVLVLTFIHRYLY